MYSYMKNYMNDIDKIIKDDKLKNYDEVISNLLIKISFFQHERLIHLLVTLFFTIFMIAFLGFGFFISPLCFIIMFILMICVILYVMHYFFLENSVQYMYKQYDKLVELNKR